MTVRELVNELTKSYVDWDEDVTIRIAEHPIKNGKYPHWTLYDIDRCSIQKPDMYIGDQCVLVVGDFDAIKI